MTSVVATASKDAAASKDPDQKQVGIEDTDECRIRSFWGNNTNHQWYPVNETYYRDGETRIDEYDKEGNLYSLIADCKPW